MVVGSSSYSQTFSPNWHVEFILGDVSGFFSHANEAERKIVSFIKKAYLKLIIFILMSRSKKVVSELLPFSLRISNSYS